jgi:hypothetical protein
MKQKKTGYAALLVAFAGILLTWLLQNHMVELVSMWKQAKAKVSPEEQNNNSVIPNQNESAQ